jgi:CRP-like cAMP-binding protein
MRARRHPDLAVLAGVAPFQRYSRRALATLAAHADRLHVRNGSVVARQGHRAREVVVVVGGMLLATRQGRPVAAFGPGTWVGAAEVLDDRAHTATFVAADDLEVVVLAGPAYRHAVRSLPGLREQRVADLGRLEAAWEHVGASAGDPGGRRTRAG